MMKIPTECPSCGGALSVVELKCEKCLTVIKGEYSIPKLIRLTDEEMNFLIVFLKARGNIKEVEKSLGVSYPTVKAKLEDLLLTLGIKEREPQETDLKKSILDAIEKGELKVEEAIKILKKE